MAVAGAAKRYGQAAFDVAKEHNALDQWERDLTMLSALLSEPGSMEYFESPAVGRSAKVKALEDILPNDDQVLVRNLLLLLLERRRFHQVQDVITMFRELVLEHRGIAVARVETAVELTPDEEMLIRERLSTVLGKEIEVLTRVNPDIIGGIVAQVGDELIDGSVRTQLAALRRRMVH
jgi:F-type H+-transporting ATPase subunit delta